MRRPSRSSPSPPLPLFVALALGLCVGPAASERVVAPVGPAPPRVAVATAKAAFAGPFEATVVRVVDGDTFAARLRVWFGQEVETLVRLRGVDAPEMTGGCASERVQAGAARAALATLLGSGRVVLTQVDGDKYFGRVVADVSVVAADGAFPAVDVGAVLVADGLARPYGGRARQGWCALEQARATR